MPQSGRRGKPAASASKSGRGRSDVEAYSGRGASPAATTAVGKRSTRSRKGAGVGSVIGGEELDVGSRPRGSEAEQDQNDMKEVQDRLDDSQIPTAETIVTNKGKTVQGSKGVRWASPLADTGSEENESNDEDDEEFTVAQLNEIGDDDSPDEELYPEEASLDVIEVPKASAIKMELIPTQQKGKTAGRAKAGAKSGPKSLKLDGTICLGVHSRDRLLRTIRIEPSESYDRLVLAVRKHVNDLNSDLELAYSLAWMPKSERHALETQDDWEELIQVIAGNKRKLLGQHHALLYHFLDKEAATQGGGKGKGKKKGTSSENQDLTASMNISP